MRGTWKLAALGLFVLSTAPVARADDSASSDVKQGAEQTRQGVEKGTRQAGRHVKHGAKRAKDAGNNGAYSIQRSKDAAKAQWEKDHPDAGGAGSTSGQTDSSTK
jgi:hypothetical protein